MTKITIKITNQIIPSSRIPARRRLLQALRSFLSSDGDYCVGSKRVDLEWGTGSVLETQDSSNEEDTGCNGFMR